MKESDILYEKGDYWVARFPYGKGCAYFVFRNGVCAATSDSGYPLDTDGLSLAKARVDYLAGRSREKRLAEMIARCTSCGETKPLAEFSPHRAKRNGAQSRCKACMAARLRLWHASRKTNLEPVWLSPQQEYEADWYDRETE